MTLLYVLLVVLGVLALGDLMWLAIFFELVHGHFTKALVIFIAWLLLTE